jgi:hypothetical protein
MQVSTIGPVRATRRIPARRSEIQLGCISGDNDVEVSQHFFALKLDANDVVEVLEALANASVITDPNNPQIVHNGGPAAIQSAVNALGTKSASNKPIIATLSSGVALISKSRNRAHPELGREGDWTARRLKTEWKSRQDWRFDRHAFLCHFWRHESTRVAYQMRQQPGWSRRHLLRSRQYGTSRQRERFDQRRHRASQVALKRITTRLLAACGPSGRQPLAIDSVKSLAPRTCDWGSLLGRKLTPIFVVNAVL